MATGGPPVNTAPNICTLQTLFLKNKMPLQVGASQKQQKRHIIIFSLKKCQKNVICHRTIKKQLPDRFHSLITNIDK